LTEQQAALRVFMAVERCARADASFLVVSGNSAIDVNEDIGILFVNEKT
jgi:hypothetical protein